MKYMELMDTLNRAIEAVRDKECAEVEIAFERCNEENGAVEECQITIRGEITRGACQYIYRPEMLNIESNSEARKDGEE